MRSHHGSDLGLKVDAEAAARPKRSKNDIKDIRSYKQLEKVELDLESPRFL